MHQHSLPLLRRRSHPLVLRRSGRSRPAGGGTAGHGGGGQIGTLTFEVNDEVVGIFSGEDKVIDIEVPIKMSQLVNDSSYITRDKLTDELVEEIKKDIEEQLGGNIETSQNKVQFITEEGSETEYPTTKAVIDYINRHTMTEEEINEIINSDI